MSAVNRYRLVVVLAAFLFALGCTSTSPVPKPGAHQEFDPVAKTSDSNAVALRQASVTLEPVYFDTDEAVLRIDTRDLLKGHAQSILAHPEWGVVTIEGHCDERGSDEYNRALGRRRAAAVERGRGVGAEVLQKGARVGRFGEARAPAGDESEHGGPVGSRQAGFLGS